MYVHAVAFEVANLRRPALIPAPKWGYLVVVRETPGFDDELTYVRGMPTV